MTTLYTGYGIEQLNEHCVADFRFFRNSLLNFRPGTVENIGHGPAGSNEELFRAAAPQIWQSKVVGIPCVTVEIDTDGFQFPDGLDDYLGVDGGALPIAFTAEWLSWPQDRGSEVYLAFLGEAGAANPYVGLNMNRTIQLNFGANNASDQITWWWADAPLHFVLTRTAGLNPDFSCYCNGTRVLWNGAETVAGGNNGLTDAAGSIYNHLDDGAVAHPCFGHHILFRVYDVAMAETDVRYMFQNVHRLVPQELFHIPIWQLPA